MTMAMQATGNVLPSDDAASRELGDLRLGIVGAGKLGTTIARVAIAAGYDVAISGSGPADDIALTVDVLAPGARAVTTAEVVRHADIVILAVPTHRFRELPRDRFDGKILVDAMNHWEPVDGADPELDENRRPRGAPDRSRTARHCSRMDSSVASIPGRPFSPWRIPPPLAARTRIPRTVRRRRPTRHGRAR